MTKTPIIHWCDSCIRHVEPTEHDVTESVEFWGAKTCEAFFEYRCPLCSEVVVEEIACIECKEARPESGADHCRTCLARIEAEEISVIPALRELKERLRELDAVEDIGSYYPCSGEAHELANELDSAEAS